MTVETGGEGARWSRWEIAGRDGVDILSRKNIIAWLGPYVWASTPASGLGTSSTTHTIDRLDLHGVRTSSRDSKGPIPNPDRMRPSDWSIVLPKPRPPHPDAAITRRPRSASCESKESTDPWKELRTPFESDKALTPAGSLVASHTPLTRYHSYHTPSRAFLSNAPPNATKERDPPWRLPS